MRSNGQTAAAAMLAVLAGVAVVFARRGETAAVLEERSSSPALAPDRSMATFELAAAEMQVDLIAAEPDVTAPVAMRFDENGALWVVEMPSYMLDVSASGELQAVNRITVFEDLDRDGTFETRNVFLDGLKLPRGVLPCFQQNGRAALVIEPPNVYFAEDTDGDMKADKRTPVLSGIGGLDNPEHAPNGLQWGMDNWIEFSQHSVAFRLTKSPSEGGKAEIRSNPGHGQWGIAMDDLGRLYYVPNSDALRVDALPKWYAARAGGRMPALFENAARDQLVWPAHETPGVNRGYQPDILRENGRLRSHTAACGPSIIRTKTLGEDWFGDAIVCEPAGNMVRRLKLKDEGGIPRAKNAYEKTELLRSTDERFRPVNSCVGPDGAVYIADMYRGVIQHKTYLTPYLKEQIAERGLETPTVMGRIYRIKPKDGLKGGLPRMSDGKNAALPGAALVMLLEHEDGWVRDAAQRLLIETNATDVTDELSAMVKKAGGGWRGKVHALWTLEGLRNLDDATLRAAAADPAEEVREQAARLAGTKAEWRAIAEPLLKDSGVRVRWQAALALGGKGGFEARSGPALVAASLAKRDDGVLRGCVVNALAGAEVESIRAIVAMKDGNRGALVSDLAEAVFRGGDGGAKVALMEFAAGGAAGGAGGGGEAGLRRVIVDRVAGVIGVGRPRPGAMGLPNEPAAWTKATTEGSGFDKGVLDRMNAVTFWLDWPGRPPVDRGAKPLPLTDDQKQAFERGREVFAVTCSACHGAEGKGVRGQTPPLAGSPRATGPVARVARIVLHGMDGGFERDGAFYNGQMPAAPLTDRQIADVLTYVRRSWGNTAPAVSAAEVLSIRMKTAGRTSAWRVDQIDSIPEEER